MVELMVRPIPIRVKFGDPTLGDGMHFESPNSSLGENSNPSVGFEIWIPGF